MSFPVSATESLEIPMPLNFNPREVEAVARAIYMANHKGPFGLPNGRTSPIWENLSDEVRDWVRKQARSAIACIDYIRAHPEYLERLEEISSREKHGFGTERGSGRTWVACYDEVEIG